VIDYRVLLKLQDKYAKHLKRMFITRAKQTRKKFDKNLTIGSIPFGFEAVYNSIRWEPLFPMPILASAYKETWKKMEVKKEAVVLDASQLQMPNPEAERWLWSYSGREVTNISEADRKMIQGILAQGMKNKESYEQTASRIYDSIGLTEPQATAMQKYRDNLVRGGHKPKTVERLVEMYYNSMLSYRAETIAITETANAVNAAAVDYYQDAQRRGVLPADEYELYWLATPSDRTCDECMAMNGRTGEISTGEVDGKVAPLHVRCRCVMQVRRK
jgi:SPP1 gp7 family putative phage head morphogenesis protein